MPPPDPKATIPLLLSLNAGYVDTAGFLALQGLFTAHVTGNFVTLGASLALGTSGAIAKLLALPIFCVVVIATRLLSTWLSEHHRTALEILIALQVVLLGMGAVLAMRFGPFYDTDSWRAVVTGMALVSAMAIQNAFHRVHLGAAPPSTIMTGTTTQLMIDLADGIHGPNETDDRSSSRLVRMLTTILIFASGCGAAASLYNLSGMKCFIVPPVVGLLQLVVRLFAGFISPGRAITGSREHKG